MKIYPKEHVKTYSLPLPIYEGIILADAIAKEGDEFDVFVGLEKKYVDQLKKLSLDESDTDLQSYTGDKRRFGEGSYETWYEKGRSIFALVHKQTDALAAIVWFGPKMLGEKSIKFGEEANDVVKDDWHTISTRSYGKFRGRKMMKEFTEYAIGIYKKYFPSAEFWAGMDDRNKAMVKLTASLGFEIDQVNSDIPEHWLVMIKK